MTWNLAKQRKAWLEADLASSRIDDVRSENTTPGAALSVDSSKQSPSSGGS